MEPASTSNRRVLVIGGILLVVLVAVIVAFINFRGTTQTTQPQQTAQTADISTILSYQPPEDAKYTALGDINFIPSQINSITVDRTKILDQAQSAHPNLGQIDLVAAINKTLFQWIAMNDFYSTSDKTKVSQNHGKAIDNYNQIKTENQQMSEEYNKKEIKLDGFFVRIRFAGVRPENIQKLGKQESELRSLAQSLITDAKSESQKFTEKERIVSFMNESRQTELLNNGEKSQVFTNRSLYPPLVSDPNYYTWAQRLLVGQFSDIMTLKMFNSQNNANEDYAFAFFYISKKSGNHLPINVLTDQFISKATIQ